MAPLNIRFDGSANIQGSNVVRMPKLNQGAPYNFGLRVRLEDESYRVWDDIVEIRWRIKLAPADKADLLVLTKSNGNFTIGEDDTLNFVVLVSDWEGITIPKSANHMEMDAPFSFVVECLDGSGNVTERLAQGSGLIVTSLD